MKGAPMKPLLAAASIAAVALTAVAVALGGATVLRLTANPHNKLAYNKALIRAILPSGAKSGRVTIVMTNPSSLRHNVAIKTSNGKIIARGKVVGKGGTSRVTAVLTRGFYSFVCTVRGHEAGGMRGILGVD
jgi:plastocyanin